MVDDQRATSDEPPPSASGQVWRTGKWILAAVFSALISLGAKQAWDAPRPFIELSTIAIRSTNGMATRVKIPKQIRDATTDHMYFTTLEAEESVESLTNAVNAARDNDVVATQYALRIDSVLAMLRESSPVIPVEQQRRTALAVWFAGHNDLLLDYEVGAAITLQPQLPKKYQTAAPSGAYPTKVDVGDGIINLANIDEAKDTTESKRFHDHGRNIVRRAWGYFEPTILIELLTETRRSMIASIAASRDLSAKVDTLIDLASPKRIVVTTAVTNRGGRPLAIDLSGLLWLRFPSSINLQGDMVPVELGGAQPDSTVILVNPGEAKVLVLVSVHPLVELGSSDSLHFGSRFQSLVDGGGIAGAVVLARAGTRPEQAFLGRSDFRLVGDKSMTHILDALRQKPPE